MPDETRPDPAEYQPDLAWWSHAWRITGMVLVSLVVWVTIDDPRSGPAIALDLVLGVVAFVVVLLLRRRLPLVVVVATAAMSMVSAAAAGPAVLAVVSLATRRQWQQVIVTAVVTVVTASAFGVIYPPAQTEPWWLTLMLNVLVTSATLAWGMYIGSRRELLWTLRARAERAEAEQELRASRSRLAERSRIAREMHDVLAHRISQISMRAGALGYRDDLTAEEVREEVVLIRDAANGALTDLRAVLGVLRDGDGDLQHAPQPTYADLGALVDEARSGGLRIDYADTVEADEPVPEVAGRTLYRIVQEGITNARKHAPGAQLDIAIAGTPEEGIEVRLSNPLGFGPAAAPGSGLGLVGLAERAALRGGRLEHTTAGGAFVLQGWIPWAA